MYPFSFPGSLATSPGEPHVFPKPAATVVAHKPSLMWFFGTRGDVTFGELEAVAGLSGVLVRFSAQYSVVDLPEPVGPVTSTIPCGVEGDFKFSGIAECGGRLYCGPHSKKVNAVLVIE